jgi:hypothetical protein
MARTAKKRSSGTQVRRQVRGSRATTRAKPRRHAGGRPKAERRSERAVVFLTPDLSDAVTEFCGATGARRPEAIRQLLAMGIKDARAHGPPGAPGRHAGTSEAMPPADTGPKPPRPPAGHGEPASGATEAMAMAAEAGEHGGPVGPETVSAYDPGLTGALEGARSFREGATELATGHRDLGPDESIGVDEDPGAIHRRRRPG